MDLEVSIVLLFTFLVPHPCHIRPCLNGALCVDSFSGYNGYPSKWNHGSLHYLCICRPGYSGLNCEGILKKNWGNTWSINLIRFLIIFTINCFVLAVDVCKNCDPYAKCINNTCICNPGYKGDGFHCERKSIIIFI